ncbi:unnamed protein product [Dimorphilus gyrociliatus]|uniref:G-protein coupled receptors family 3 profile domain-containing protein n=1 Tax=Dimorphilus gyrociliatus TaxID=2664684 RepID=A0A7I8V7I8_9ANNE|nr:unnamed protein product [Dimorphilus gyrociliatus]
MTTVHQYFSEKECGEEASIVNLKNLENMYLIKMEIDKVNNNDTILPNITIGYIFIDTCNMISPTVRRSIEMISRPKNQVCSPHENENKLFNVQAAIITLNSILAASVSNILSEFQIPQLSPTATSDDLSNKKLYKYFSRTVSPDRYEAEALADFIVNFKWNYVSLVYLEGSYGENGAKQFRKQCALKGICIAVDEMISFDKSLEDVQKTVKNIKNELRSNIIIIFLYPKQLEMFYVTMENENLLRTKYILASDSVSLTEIPLVIEKRALNTFGIAFKTQKVPGSREYLTKLNLEKHKDLLYLKTYWSIVFNCTWENFNNSTKKICDPKADLTDTNFELSAHSANHDCFLIYIEAMNRVLQKYCSRTVGLNARKCFTGERILKEIRSGTFQTTGGEVHFDKFGDIYGGYDIVQFTENSKYNIIAYWSRENSITQFYERIIWRNSQVPPSTCSLPCPPKYYYIHKAVICCWDCRQCRNNEIVIGNRTGCEECPEFFWPDKEALECVAIEADYLKWSDFETIIILTLAIFGLFLSILITSFIIWKRNEKLIKASSIQLMAITLFGIKLCLMSTFLFLTKPNDTVCSLSRYLFNISNSLIYAPLIMKTNRVFRIFSSARKGNQSVKYTSNRFQMAITLAVVLLQVNL